MESIFYHIRNFLSNIPHKKRSAYRFNYIFLYIFCLKFFIYTTELLRLYPKRMPFIIYKSSAGSGKTYTLVKEYLKLALTSDEKFRRILAITFTNKAAEEMKLRILSALAGISTKTSDKLTTELFNDLQNESGLSTEQIKVSSRRVLQNILHNYSDFAVSTIDSFVHNIVRTFARDLKLSWNFEVEIDEKRILSETVDILISSIGKDEALTRSLIEFTETQTDDEKGWHIEKPLNKLAETLLDDASTAHLARLKNLNPEDFDLLRKQLLAYVHRIESQLTGFAQAAINLIDENDLGEKEFYQRGKGIAGYFRKLSSDFELDDLSPNNYVKETIDKEKWYTKLVDKNDQKKIDRIRPQLTEYFKSIQKTITSNRNNYVLSRLILQRIHALGVLNGIDELLAQVKLKKNILLISEFNKRVHEVVAQESIPFIFERIGEKYENYLIDEFQDTSLLQWSNLLPLVDNSLASNHFNMVVGDGKQAIYRFRNGEVEQFDRLPKIYNAGNEPVILEREAALIRHHEIKSLGMNFRSSKNIVEFNNDLYDFLSQLAELDNKKIYEYHSQRHLPENTGGYISIEFIAADDENVFNQNVLDKTLSQVQMLLQEGFLKNDIAILTRYNTEASVVAAYLMDNEVPVVSSESILIYKSPDVRFITSVLHFLADSSDVIAKAEMLRYLHQKNRLAMTEIHNSFAAANQSGKFFDKLESLGYKKYLKGLTFLSLYEIAETIISAYSLNSSPDLFLQHFLDVILSYSVCEGNSIESFLIWWEENKENYSVSLPSGVDAVQVMTIHKAKGLEFPVVLLPKADWKIMRGKDNIWISPDLGFAPALESALIGLQDELVNTDLEGLFNEEIQKSFLDNLNLLYVATTRAKHRLHIFCSSVLKEPENNKTINALFIHYLQSKSLWNINKRSYEFGDPTFPQKDKLKRETTTEKVTDYVLQSASSSSWRNKIRIKQSYSDAGPQTEMSKADWGNIVHAVLSKIITIRDIHNAVKEIEVTGLIDSEQSLAMEQSLTNLLNLNDIKSFFETGLRVKTEAEMFLPGQGILRVDRVILKDNSAIVIDYKTGQTHKEDYFKQLDQYAVAIQKMGYTHVDKYLLYVTENKLEKI